MRKNVVFVCVENSNRSQMAQAFARLYGADKMEAYSAGSRPSGKINPKAVAAMQQLGYDLGTHQSKSLSDLPDVQFEYAITMGCGDECPFIKATHREDWAIPDPRDMQPEEFNKVRDIIKEKVLQLLQRL